jgi:hypothetical protein
VGGGGPLLADPSASPTSARLTDVKVVDALLNGCPSDSSPARHSRYISANQSCQLHPRKAKPLINSIKQREGRSISSGQRSWTRSAKKASTPSLASSTLSCLDGPSVDGPDLPGGFERNPSFLGWQGGSIGVIAREPTGLQLRLSSHRNRHRSLERFIFTPGVTSAAVFAHVPCSRLPR